MENFGTIVIQLDELIKKSGISKNKLCHRAELQRTQLDIDVLARICTVLNCEIGDLLKFVPPKEC